MKIASYNPFTMDDVHAASAQAHFTFGSGFTGAGGADIGMAHAGGRPIFGIELAPEAVRTFRRNFPETVVHHGDFREVAASPEIIEYLLAQGGLTRGELDVVHLSPPCNEYSKLGPGPREGGTAELIFDSVAFTKVVQPRVLTFENVPELGGKYRYILESALRSLSFDETGRRHYFANSLVLTASDYGVPQRRRRLFVIAVRADVAEADGIFSDQDVLRVFPRATHEEISIETALAGLQQSEVELHPYRLAMMTSNLGHLARRLEHDPDRWITPRKAGLGLYRFSTIRAASHLPSPTLTASGQHPDGRSGVFHPTEDRKLTIREMMRCSSFPDDYQFTGTVAQAAERIGMSVPPLLAKAIAEAVYDQVLRPYHAANHQERSADWSQCGRHILQLRPRDCE